MQELKIYPGAELWGGRDPEELIPFHPNWLFSPLSAQCDSLFQDLGKLKSRPAHLGVFLRYIFSQADPSPLVRDLPVAPTQAPRWHPRRHQAGQGRDADGDGVFGTIPFSG